MEEGFIFNFNKELMPLQGKGDTESRRDAVITSVRGKDNKIIGFRKTDVDWRCI